MIKILRDVSVAVFLLIGFSMVFALESSKNQTTLSEGDKKSLTQLDLILLMRNNNRVKFDEINEGKKVIVADPKAGFRVNIDAITSSSWIVNHADGYGRGGVSVDRAKIFNEIFKNNPIEYIKAKIQLGLEAQGIYPITFGGNEGLDGPFSSEAQVILRTDLNTPRGQYFHLMLKDKDVKHLATIDAVNLYEEFVLGAPLKEKSIEILNNSKESIVRIAVYDPRDEKLLPLGNAIDTLVASNSKISFGVPEEWCVGTKKIIIFFSNAKYSEIDLSNSCSSKSSPDLLSLKKFEVNGNTIKYEWLMAFYSSIGKEFVKTEGKFNNGLLSGWGWTKFYGDVSASRFKDGLRNGFGFLCTKNSTYGRVDVYYGEWTRGVLTKKRELVIWENKPNQVLIDRRVVYKSFGELYQQYCLPDYKTLETIEKDHLY